MLIKKLKEQLINVNLAKLLEFPFQFHFYGNKPREIKRTNLPWPKPKKNIKIKEIIINSLRIGHRHITRGYLIAKKDQPTCQSCGTYYYVKNILVECRLHGEVRKNL